MKLKDIKGVPNPEICCKCRKEVSFYIIRTNIFKRIKIICFECNNKKKFSTGKLELKEVVINSDKDDYNLGGIWSSIDDIIDDITSTPTNRLQIPKEDIIPKPYSKLSNNDKNFNIPIEMASHIHSDSNIEILSIKKSNIYTEKIKDKKESKFSTFKIIDISTGKDISKDMEIQIHTDKESKPFREMKSECFDCGYNNIGFKNIPSEICFECSIYDVEKTDNKYKKEVKRNGRI